MGTTISVSDTGLILGLGSAYERRCYFVTKFLIGWAQTQNQRQLLDVSMYNVIQYTKKRQSCASINQAYMSHFTFKSDSISW